MLLNLLVLMLVFAVAAGRLLGGKTALLISCAVATALAATYGIAGYGDAVWSFERGGEDQRRFALFWTAVVWLGGIVASVGGVTIGHVWRARRAGTA